MKNKLLLLLAALGCAGALAQPSANGLIVQLRDAPTHEQRMGAHALALRDDARWQRVLDGAGVRAAASRPSGAKARLLQFEHRLTQGQAQALAERLQRQPDVAWVVPNERERRLQTPNDPMFVSQEQWWLLPVGGSDGNVIAQRRRGVPGFQRGWMQSTGSAAARVAVLDTGITSHPELSGRVVGGHDFVSDVAVANDGNGRDADPSDPGDWVSAADAATKAFEGCTVEDSSWHGTLIAGIVAARTNEGAGVAGANWDGRIVPVRVAGKCGADVHDIVDGMRWAAGLAVAGAPPNANPARIINLSFGGSAACNAAYQSAIDDIRAAGAVLVTAAGNERSAPTRPANCAGVIGVAAVNRDGFKTNYSNFGQTLSIATVGGDDNAGLWGNLFDDGGLLTIYNRNSPTTLRDHGHAYLFGTSFATPVVAGALSLMLSVNPALTADELRTGLARSARPHVTSPHIGACSAANPWRCLCTTTTCGAGLLDVEQALLYARDPATYVAPNVQPAELNNAETAAAAARGPDSGAAAPPPPPASTGGGGGAMHPGWLLALLAATIALLRRRS